MRFLRFFVKFCNNFLIDCFVIRLCRAFPRCLPLSRLSDARRATNGSNFRHKQKSPQKADFSHFKINFTLLKQNFSENCNQNFLEHSQDQKRRNRRKIQPRYRRNQPSERFENRFRYVRDKFKRLFVPINLRKPRQKNSQNQNPDEDVEKLINRTENQCVHKKCLPFPTKSLLCSCNRSVRGLRGYFRGL